MSRLRTLQVWMAAMVLCTGLAVVPKLVAAGTQTFTGKVSDAMCGAKHSEGNLTPSLRACLRAEGRKIRFGSRRQDLYSQHLGSSLVGRTQQIGLGAGHSHGHSRWRYHFGEGGRCCQIGDGGWLLQHQVQ